MADLPEAITRAPSGSPGAPSAASVAAQLDRILESPSFAGAPSLSRFLRHLIQQALSSHPDQLKEYSIGVEVFDRGEAFDPRIDNIVRVQARRLRAKLAEYYTLDGRTDPVIIEIPKGQYLAEFRYASPENARTSKVVTLDAGQRLGPAPDSRPAPSGQLWSLPTPRTPLIGREQELANVKRMLLDDEVRLITLSGAGGSGKTRLAVQAASELTYQFSGGVWFIPLATISAPDLVASMISQALSLRNVAGKPLAVALREHVHAPALLLIDNAEHVLEAAPLFGELLDACLALKILVTSRAVLHLYGEHEFSVLPLPTPDLSRLPPIGELRQNPAVQLLIQRATAVDPAFELNSSNYRAVAEVCCRLDGLPLAIELAAAAMRTLHPAGILARLERRLELLTGGARDVHARQQTLRNTVGWSHALLDPFEQKLFRRLAVFAGGCTLESAEAICDAHRDLDITVLQGISALLDKSLLYQRDRAGSGESRFAMLESIREFAAERLLESGEETTIRQAHAAYCLVVAEERTALHTPAEIGAWLELCSAEHGNFRSALDWLIRTGRGEWALRLGLALFHFWEAKEHLGEGREWLRRVLTMKGTAAVSGNRARTAFCAAAFGAALGDYDGALREFQEARRIYAELGDDKGVAALLTAIGTNRRLSGDLHSGRTWLEQALRAYRALRDRPGIAGALSNLADVVNAQGHPALARTLLEEALAIFRELGDSAGIGWSLNRLGDVAFEQRDLSQARRLYDEGLDIFRTTGDRWGMARSFSDLGYVACDNGKHNDARALFIQALDMLRTLGNTRGIAKILEGFACLAINEGEFERALMLAGAATGLREALGAAPRPDDEITLQRKLKAAWEHFDAAQAKALAEAGSRMPLEEAVRYALEEPG